MYNSDYFFYQVIKNSTAKIRKLQVNNEDTKLLSALVKCVCLRSLFKVSKEGTTIVSMTLYKHHYINVSDVISDAFKVKNKRRFNKRRVFLFWCLYP